MPVSINEIKYFSVICFVNINKHIIDTFIQDIFKHQITESIRRFFLKKVAIP